MSRKQRRDLWTDRDRIKPKETEENRANQEQSETEQIRNRGNQEQRKERREREVGVSGEELKIYKEEDRTDGQI